MALTLRLGKGALLAAAAFGAPLAAQDAEATDEADAAVLGISGSPAVGTEVFFSSDSDDTTVWRLAGEADIVNAPDGSRIGVRYERAWYDPQGLGEVTQDRIFVQAADRGGDVEWFARIGTDGDTVIGSASVNDNARFRKEAFVERDIVVTRQGLDLGLYSTFAGAAIDLPVDDSNVFTLLGGVQEFTGDNLRLHARANFVHVLDRDAGLSAQLRTRYFHSTVPGEYDYFSPENYAQILPVLQMRRFVGGWNLLAAGGIGVQKSTGTDWDQANYAEARFTSPERGNWSVSGQALYSQTPGDAAVAGSGYDYFQANFSLLRRF